jgi:hypothetical protein
MKDKNTSAAIYMKSFIENKHHHMKAYFTIYNEEKQYKGYKNK